MYLISMNSISFAYTGLILIILCLYAMFYMYIFEMWHFIKLLTYFIMLYGHKPK